MQPEISQRCTSCGASLREPAMFCPECGKPLSKPAGEPEPKIVTETSAPEIVKATADGSVAAISQTEPVSKAGTYEKAREGLHRASTATREALADNVKRVGTVSSAVLEEATYDPSLRFVLVALVIFVVFVVLLLLSKVMG